MCCHIFILKLFFIKKKIASITQMNRNGVHLIQSSLTFLNLHYLSCTLVVVADLYPHFLPDSG